ncbi:TPA: hypothetical protein N0F65_005384 [Lagenidium giganteum]|uniref:Uncharacterized protein n=1 Tax=Lagenidium giganteum TaxID=4803 RepID=A0AAV2YXV0_9STRA|nr:TPA: hypothetical protein N0F65_005384 [Lagenidium giganteum]
MIHPVESIATCNRSSWRGSSKQDSHSLREATNSDSSPMPSRLSRGLRTDASHLRSQP